MLKVVGEGGEKNNPWKQPSEWLTGNDREKVGEENWKRGGGGQRKKRYGKLNTPPLQIPCWSSLVFHSNP